MALDTNLPMQGQQLDTASPLMNLVEMTRQSRLDNAQLATSGIDLQSKQNVLASQTMAAAAGSGNQNIWTATKQKLQQSGIDTTGIPDDIASEQKWADDARMAQSPYGALVNAASKLDANAAAAAGPNGTTVVPNQYMNNILHIGQPASQQQQASAPQPQAAAQSTPTTQAVTAAMNNVPNSDIPQKNVTPAATPPALPPDGQSPQDVQQLQQHYQNASPEDQKTAQNIVNGAMQLQSMQGDPQAVQKFLDDASNLHDEHNITMRKLWMNDQTPDKQQFWQQNAIDVKAGQAMGIAPADSPKVNPDYPNPPQQNENPKTRNDRQAGNLAIQKTQIENSPTQKQKMTDAETEAKNAADYKNSLINKTSEDEGAIRIINAQEKLLTEFTPGAGTTKLAELANVGKSLGLPDNVVKMIGSGNPAAIQAFQGLSSQHALLQLKSLVDGGRINKTEYQGFKEDLANPDKMKEAILSINQIQKDNYAAQLKELGAMTAWEQSGKPLSTFKQNYAQTVGSELMKAGDNGIPSFSNPSDPAFKSLPAGSKFIDKDTGKTMVKH